MRGEGCLHSVLCTCFHDIDKNYCEVKKLTVLYFYSTLTPLLCLGGQLLSAIIMLDTHILLAYISSSIGCIGVVLSLA